MSTARKLVCSTCDEAFVATPTSYMHCPLCQKAIDHAKANPTYSVTIPLGNLSEADLEQLMVIVSRIPSTSHDLIGTTRHAIDGLRTIAKEWARRETQLADAFPEDED